MLLIGNYCNKVKEILVYIGTTEYHHIVAAGLTQV